MSFHSNQPSPPLLPEGTRFSGKWHKSILVYGNDTLGSVEFGWFPGIGGEVALERLPAFVVVLIQTIGGLESPLSDSQT